MVTCRFQWLFSGFLVQCKDLFCLFSFTDNAIEAIDEFAFLEGKA